MPFWKLPSEVARKARWFNVPYLRFLVLCKEEKSRATVAQPIVSRYSPNLGVVETSRGDLASGRFPFT